MSTDRDTTPSRDGLGRLLPVLAVVVLLGTALAIFFGVRGGDDDAAERRAQDPTSSTSSQEGVTTLGAPANLDARCMAPTAETLGTADLAFDAQVDDISPEGVTLTPVRWFKGDETETVRVEAPPAELDGLVQTVSFQVGKRYLVAANGTSVMICGFSGPYEPNREKLYRTAFAE